VAEVGLERLRGCIRLRDGAVRCWDALARAGDPARREALLAFAAEPRGRGATWLRVLQLDTRVGGPTGSPRCWGANGSCELDPNAARAGQLDAIYPLGIPDAVDVVGAMGFLCARTRCGGVVCQGTSTLGEAGDGTAGRDQLTPVRG
jgi:hypothetical protein